MQAAFVFDAARTPRGRGKPGAGSLQEVAPVVLAAGVFRFLADRNGLKGPEVEDVILGCVDPVGDQAGDVARSAALAARLGDEVPGVQINRFCASGLEAVAMAAARVRAGDAQLVFAGGLEMMSRVGMGGSGMPVLTDPALALPLRAIPQGIAADLLATIDGRSRAEVDAFAAESHRRAAAAWTDGRFQRSVVPVRDGLGLTILERDETIRPDVSEAGLLELEPAFAAMARLAGFDAVAIQRYPGVERISHVHHAGNSSQIADGAAAVILGSEAAALEHGLTPRGRILSSVTVGSEPTIMLTGPVEACRRALAKAGLSVADVDVWEVNEAFASVVLHVVSQLGLDQERVNPNGGAIAMGHPLGATGAMLLGTLLDELERSGGRYGVATLCAASGQAIAMVLERMP
ncbi:acetyl-CoA C-acetyltransferase [Sphingomonas sp. CCH18-H6]|uniref:acetyl-CoA C-acetyltransferase n=1 Tax=Sphingomonas sp. CCH18-H6 TaxID=1768787 RepID=UPI00082A9525|nr:acetyl-CoA C-acetyltransferase [Sphingomonas sp. CCH18-H6]